MRIIDKNVDFYDYCQRVYPDDLVTFDRRDSYVLTKEEFARKFTISPYSYIYKVYEHNIFGRTRIVLLQVCNTFWMFKLFATKLDEDNNIEEYTLDLLDQWKDYDVPSVALELSTVEFSYYVYAWHQEFTADIIENLKQAIHTNNIRKREIFNKFYIHKNGEKEERHIPILRDIGIAALVKPEEIYFALDEYFSKQITDSERTESIGLTDKERAVNHGFDAKTSFRGKIK